MPPKYSLMTHVLEIYEILSHWDINNSEYVYFLKQTVRSTGKLSIDVDLDLTQNVIANQRFWVVSFVPTSTLGRFALRNFELGEEKETSSTNKLMKWQVIILPIYSFLPTHIACHCWTFSPLTFPSWSCKAATQGRVCFGLPFWGGGGGVGLQRW